MSETGLFHFDHAMHASRAWVHDLMNEMNWRDEHCSYQALRSVLHALRDALPIDDVIALGSEMPLFVRGSYYEGWHPAKHRGYRKTKKKDFLAHVAKHTRHNPACDPEKLAHGVFKILARHVSQREIEKIKTVCRRTSATCLSLNWCSRARCIVMKKKPIHAADLGIALRGRDEAEYFKWFLACLLFGKPIQQEVARRTYEEFVREGLVTLEAVLQADWDKLVEVLDRGHYVRYDFSTATKLLEICRQPKSEYGSIVGLLSQARSRRDLSRRLQTFKGIGPVTARIFLRDFQNGSLDPRRRRRHEQPSLRRCRIAR